MIGRKYLFIVKRYSTFFLNQFYLFSSEIYKSLQLVFSLRSSIPGHEYLEADYECAPGFYMVSTTNRLLCRNRQWMGQLPKCKIKANFEGACIDASCDHVCKEIDGRPVCSCYKGFRLENDKCMGKFAYNSYIFACNIIQIIKQQFNWQGLI